MVLLGFLLILTHNSPRSKVGKVTAYLQGEQEVWGFNFIFTVLSRWVKPCDSWMFGYLRAEVPVLCGMDDEQPSRSTVGFSLQLWMLLAQGLWRRAMAVHDKCLYYFVGPKLSELMPQGRAIFPGVILNQLHFRIGLSHLVYWCDLFILLKHFWNSFSLITTLTATEHFLPDLTFILYVKASRFIPSANGTC